MRLLQSLPLPDPEAAGAAADDAGEAAVGGGADVDWGTGGCDGAAGDTLEVDWGDGGGETAAATGADVDWGIAAVDGAGARTAHCSSRLADPIRAWGGGLVRPASCLRRTNPIAGDEAGGAESWNAAIELEVPRRSGFSVHEARGA